MKKLIALLIIALFVLTGCVSAISKGTITSKENRPAYYSTTMVCSGYNSKGGCTVWVPIQNYHAPTWWFNLAEGEETGWVYVTETTYGQYEPGDYFEGVK